MLCLGSPPSSNSSSVSTQTSQASSSARSQQKFDVGLIHAMLSASETDGALKKAIASRTYELKGTEAALHEVCYKLYKSTTKLISVFVFATRIVQSLYF